MPTSLRLPPAESVCWKEDSTCPSSTTFPCAFGTAPLSGGLAGDKVVAVTGSCWGCSHTSQRRAWVVLPSWVYLTSLWQCCTWSWAVLNHHDSTWWHVVMHHSGAGSEFTQTLLRDCGSAHSSCAGCCTNKRITDMPVASTEMHPFWFMPVCFGFKAITKPQLLFWTKLFVSRWTVTFYLLVLWNRAQGHVYCW